MSTISRTAIRVYVHNFTYTHLYTYSLTHACTVRSIFLPPSLSDAASGSEGHKLKDFSPPLLECIIAWCTHPSPPTKLGLLFAIFLHGAASSLIIPLSWSFHLSYHWADLWSNLYSTWSALNNWAIFGALSGYQCKNINRYSILFQYRKLGEQSWNTKAWIPILINSNSNILINRLYPEWLFVCLFSFSFFSQLDLRLVDCLWHERHGGEGKLG